ncbi:hypothetical protein [Bradyrhizobium sp. McL0615]|uniref:hypothetical protein n=1 Tax=Bradyrhizobium sp. McL0615 TaxID=3415673 RepID=UPI003CF84BE7
MTPFLNSVEIQAQVPAITAMTIRKKAIDPRSSPTLCLLLPCFYLVGFFISLATLRCRFFPLLFSWLDTSKLSHHRFDRSG